MAKCSYCQKVEATWVYMPNGEYACDECVPRKCSCNMKPKDGDWESTDDNNWEYAMDYGEHAKRKSFASRQLRKLKRLLVQFR